MRTPHRHGALRAHPRPRGRVRHSLLGLAAILVLLWLPDTAGAASVAHHGFSHPSIVSQILADAGHSPRALGVAEIENGALVGGHYDVFVVSRSATLLGASPAYVKGVGDFLAAGGNVVTELSGLAMFFSAYAPDARFSMRLTPQLGVFDGIVHAGAFHATATPIELVQVQPELLDNLPNPLVDGGGTEFFVWFETSDPDLTLAGHFIGNGRPGFPSGQELPTLAFGCEDAATVVLSGWDWNDTLAFSDRSRMFLTNAVDFALGNACGGVGVTVDVKPDDEENRINPRQRGVVPVAILTTREDQGDASTFDSAEVNPLTLELGPSGASPAHRRGHYTDVDGDGDEDLLLHFPVSDTGVTCEDTALTIAGETWDGREIEGTDAIQVVGCSRR